MGIFILRDNQQHGPYEESLLREQLATGAIPPDTMAWMEGTPAWRPLADLLPETIPAPATGVVREVAPPRIPFSAIFLDSIRFPFRRSAWITILVGALFFTLTGLLSGFIGGIFISGYLFAFYLEIIASSASGGDECPKWPGFSSFMDDIFIPYFRGMGATIIALAPALLLAWLAARDDSLPLLVAAGAGVIWSAFYYPMAIIGVVVFGNFGGALPHRVIPALFRTFPASLLLGLTSILLLTILFFNGRAASHIPFVGHFYRFTVYLFLLTVQGRFLGLFYRRESTALQWV